jgi:hypothetical protein
MQQLSAVDVSVRLAFGEAFRASVRIVLRRFFPLLVLFGVMAALSGTLLIFALLKPAPQQAWYESAKNPVALYWAVSLPLFIFVGLPLLSARQVVTDERMKRGFRYEFSDEGVHIEGPISNANLKWEAIKRAQELRWGFLLFPTKNVAHIIPNRCFASPEDAGRLRELLKLHVRDARGQA